MMANNMNDYNSLNCITDPQMQLSNALSKRNLREFRIVLDMGADATIMDTERYTNIYERALITPGCEEFIMECLRRGCSPYYVNTHYNKAAINYVCESMDPKNIKCLLQYPKIQVDRKYSELTPINYLAKGLTSDNISNALECIKILLDYGASPNIPDQREMTPLHYIIKNRNIDAKQKNDIVEYFLQLPNLDIDTYRDGELREILQQNYPDLINNLQSLSSKPAHRLLDKKEGKGKSSDTRIPIGLADLELLLCYIRSKNIEKFKHHFQLSNINFQNNQEAFLALLIESIKSGNHIIFDMILSSIIMNDNNNDNNDNNNDDNNDNNDNDKIMNCDININIIYNCSTPIEVATVYGNWYALQKLLDHPNVKLCQRNDQPLVTIIRHLNDDCIDDYCDYRKCFYILLESNKININEQDNSGSTPLHYAVKYRLNEAIIELLKRGAYIGIKNHFKYLPIDGIHPDILERHFDNCITSNDAKMGDDNYEIYINYMNLLFITNNNNNNNNNRIIYDEMSPITYLAKSKEYRHLLQHPLITSFLYLKWHRLSMIFYINFMIYILFTLSILIHTILKFNGGNDYQLLTTIFGICSWFGIIYLIIREFLQLLMSPYNYIKSFTNYMEIILIILAIMTCTEPNYDKETQRIVAVFTMLLIAIELCLLVGSLPILSLSTHLLMLDAVFWSFLKSFTLYSIFVIAFSLCFYILFGKPEYNPDKDTDIDATDSAAMDAVAINNHFAKNITKIFQSNNDDNMNDNNEDFNKFKNPLAALIKTIVMLTGEFDAGDLEFDTLFSYLLFLAFVFLMTMVLFNLLNGLAVSDTQTIKDQAELNGYICRTNLLSRYEEVLISGHSKHLTSFLVQHQPFRYLGHYLIHLYPNYINTGQITVLPNDNNRVYIYICKEIEKREDKIHMNCRKNSTLGAFLPTSNANIDYEKREYDLDRNVQVPLPCCCCNCLMGKCSQMDNRTVKLAMNVLEQKTKTMRNERQLKSTEQRLQNLESKLDRILDILKDIPKNKQINF